MQLFHFNTAFSQVNTLYGINPDPSIFEDLAMYAWEKIGNKHTRFYKFTSDTEDKELLLPCNVTSIESVTIPAIDAQWSTNSTSGPSYENIAIERFIDSVPTDNDILYQKGKYVKYHEGGDVLYFNRDYKDVTVLYQGVIVDEEDGLPLLNNREINAIAAYVAYAETFRDALKKRDANALKLAQVIEAKWLRECNAARVPDHISQNEMNEILDVKTRWDRKQFGKSLKPIL